MRQDSGVSAQDSPAGARLAVAAGVVEAATVAVYLALIYFPDGRLGLETLGIAILLAAPGIAAIASVRAGTVGSRLTLRAGAAGALLSLSYLALFSIGLLVFVAGMLALLGTVRLAVLADGAAHIRAALVGVGAAVLPWLLILLR